MNDKQYEGLSAFVNNNKELLSAFLKRLLDQHAPQEPETGNGTTNPGTGSNTDTSTRTDDYAVVDWSPVDVNTDKISDTLDKYNETFNGLINNVDVLKNTKLEEIKNVLGETKTEGQDKRELTVVTQLSENSEDKSVYNAHQTKLILPNEVLTYNSQTTILPDESGMITLPPTLYIGATPIVGDNGVEEGQEYHFSDMAVRPIKINLTSWKQTLDNMGSTTLILPLDRVKMTDLEESYLKYLEREGKKDSPEYLGAEKVKWYHKYWDKNNHEPTAKEVVITEQNSIFYQNVSNYTGANYIIRAEVYNSDEFGNVDYENQQDLVYSTFANTALLDINELKIKSEKILPNRNYAIRFSFQPLQTTIINNSGHTIAINSGNETLGRFWKTVFLRTYYGEQYISLEFRAEGSTPTDVPVNSLNNLLGTEQDLRWESGKGFNQEKSKTSIYQNNIISLFYESPYKVVYTKNTDIGTIPEASAVTGTWYAKKQNFYNYCGGCVSSPFSKNVLTKKKIRLYIPSFVKNMSNLKMKLCLVFIPGNEKIGGPSYFGRQYQYIKIDKVNDQLLDSNKQVITESPLYNIKDVYSGILNTTSISGSPIWTYIDLTNAVDYEIPLNEAGHFRKLQFNSSGNFNYNATLIDDLNSWIDDGTCYLHISLCPEEFWKSASTASASCAIESIELLD